MQRNNDRFRDFFLDIVIHPSFDIFIMACIILNTVALAIKWYNTPENVIEILEIVNYIFSGIFTIEAIMKLIALGGRYFNEGWNVFDFVIVIGTYIGVIVGQTTNVSVGPQTTVIRSFRIMRIFRLVKKAKSLRIISTTFIISIPALANVGGLLMLLLYLYSILGSFSFAFIKLGQAGFNMHANFQTFGRSFLTLMRLSTADSWIDL